MHRDHPLLPFAMTLAGVAMLSLMDAFMKSASLAVGAYSAALLRSTFGVLLIAPIWLGRGGRWPQRPALKLHLLRGTVSAFMALSFFYAITKLPLADAIAISFIAPLIALYLAAVILGEEIQRKAIYASILGFAGTMVIVGGKLGGEQVGPDLWLGLGALLFSTLLYAWNFILIRQQSQLAGPAEVATFHSGVSAVLMSLGAPFFFAMPTQQALVDAGLAAMLTVAASAALAWAYARAEAQALVPVEYSGFLWASLFGWMFFAERVSAPTIAGTALIVIGCWIAARSPTEQSTV